MRSINKKIILYNETGNYAKYGRKDHSLQDQEKSAVCYINIAQLMELIGDNEAAAEYYEKAIQSSSGWEEDKELDDRFNRIGDILDFNGHSKEALEYYEKALAVFESLGDEKRITAMIDKIKIKKI